jgi:hypothetical protein
MTCVSFVRWCRAGLLGAACLVASAGVVSAQSQTDQSAQAAGRFEVGLGVNVTGTANLGSQDANLTANATGGAAFTWFTTDARYATPKGVDMRASYRLTPSLLAGVSAAVQRGDVRVRISGDTEAANTVSFTGEPLGQALIQGRLDLLAPSWRLWHKRLTPYAAVSGGYLRQWHEGNAIIETGSVIEAGAGVRWLPARKGKRSGPQIGAAAEVRMTRSAGGFHWGRESRIAPSIRLECFTAWGR